MSSSETVSMQQMARKVDTLERRLKRVEKFALPIVRLNDKEMAALEKTRQQIRNEKVLREKELFDLLRK